MNDLSRMCFNTYKGKYVGAVIKEDEFIFNKLLEEGENPIFINGDFSLKLKNKSAFVFASGRSDNEKVKKINFSPKDYLGECFFELDDKNQTVKFSPIDKKSLRKIFLKMRDEIDEEVRTKKSLNIKDNLFSLEEVKSSKTLFLFSSFRSEVETMGIIKEARRNNINIALPRVFGKTMDFYLVTEEDNLEKGAYGIMEPKEGLLKVTPDENSAILFPGAVFDVEGRRIGYGGGYYDKYFKKYPSDKKISIAFEEQVLVGSIPTEKHDLSVNIIVTDKRIIRCDGV